MIAATTTTVLMVTEMPNAKSGAFRIAVLLQMDIPKVVQQTCH
jgi:hypothetical protein